MKKLLEKMFGITEPKINQKQLLKNQPEIIELKKQVESLKWQLKDNERKIAMLKWLVNGSWKYRVGDTCMGGLYRIIDIDVITNFDIKIDENYTKEYKIINLVNGKIKFVKESEL